MEKTELEKLAVLIPHWVEHNEEHGKEFRKWADRANAQGHAAVHDEILQAIEQMDRANASLLKALEHLGGAASGE